MAVCLVTGGAGCIGSHLADALVARGDTVRILDNFSAGKWENLARVRSQVDLIFADLWNLDSVRKTTQGVDFVFHLACPDYEAPGELDPLRARWASAIDTLHVLIAAQEARVRRVVYASGSAVYGNPKTGIVDEQSPTSPTSRYGFAKLLGEHHCLAFTTLYGLETVRLRFFNVYGPRQARIHPCAHALPMTLNSMLAGRCPVLSGDLTRSEDYLYVDDAVHALLLAAKEPRVAGKVYNIARGRPATVLDIIETLNNLLGTQLTPVGGNGKDQVFPSFVVDGSRAEIDLGFCPAMDLTQGLTHLVQSLRPQDQESPAAHIETSPQGPHFPLKEQRSPATSSQTEQGRVNAPEQS